MPPLIEVINIRNNTLHVCNTNIKDFAKHPLKSSENL